MKPHKMLLCWLTSGFPLLLSPQVPFVGEGTWTGEERKRQDGRPVDCHRGSRENHGILFSTTTILCMLLCHISPSLLSSLPSFHLPSSHPPPFSFSFPPLSLLPLSPSSLPPPPSTLPTPLSPRNSPFRTLQRRWATCTSCWLNF